MRSIEARAMARKTAARMAALLSLFLARPGSAQTHHIYGRLLQRQLLTPLSYARARADGWIWMDDGSTLGCAVKTTSVLDRKSTRLNSSHVRISYAVFCLKKK